MAATIKANAVWRSNSGQMDQGEAAGEGGVAGAVMPEVLAG
jgi:hypothetical protein